jgi:hypothetical protein
VREKKSTARGVKRTPARKKTATRRLAVKTRTAKASRSLAPSQSTSKASSSPAIGPGPIIFGVACVVCFVGAVALLPAHENTAAAGSQPTTISNQPPTASGRQTVNGQAPAANARNARSAAKTESQHAPVLPLIEAKQSTAPTVPTSEPVKTAYSGWEPAVKAGPVEPISAPAPETVASVTITGCLEHDDETFWLSNASGSEAPTSRSWRSGFLKKRPSRIELVDAGHALRLTSYVGQRIAATGTLINREMRTRSLHSVSASCS